ncbi:MAG: hypothetical protein ACYC3G_03695 [Minisyncoccota bacterium]
MESFNFYNGKKFEQPVTQIEIEAAKKAAEKVLKEVQEKEAANREQEAREVQAKIRIQEQLSKEGPVYEITKEDERMAEEIIKKL